MLLTPAQIKPKSFESRRSFFPLFFFFFFKSEVDASHVYVGAWALGRFHSHMTNIINTQTFRRALIVSVDNCAEIKSASSVA